jgi:DNA repair exonuclease SbcCD ATPase subunit
MTAEKSEPVSMAEIVKTNGNGNGYDKLLPLASIILALIGLFWSVANPRDDIKEIKQELQAEIDQLGREKLTLAEHREYVMRKDKDTDRIDGEISTIRADLVPRAEHEQHWREQLDQLNVLRDQVSGLLKEVNGSWDIGKQLDNLQKEIDDLRSHSVAAPRSGVADKG